MARRPAKRRASRDRHLIRREVDRWMRRHPAVSRPATPRAPRPAAGLLPIYVDAAGVGWVLLGLRSRRLGGTWSNIGGSLEAGEDVLAGALRETWEEIRIPAGRLVGSVIRDVVDDCGTESRPYTLVVLEVPSMFDNASLGWENDDLAWFPAAEVAALDLHPGFARAWSTLQGRAAVAFGAGVSV